MTLQYVCNRQFKILQHVVLTILLVGSYFSVSGQAIQIEKNSTIHVPQLRLTEIGQDFSRITFDNSAQVGKFWTIAAETHSIGTQKINFYYHNAVTGIDRFTVTGDGKVGINTTNPSVELDVRQIINPTFFFDAAIEDKAGIRLHNANETSDVLLFVAGAGSLHFGFKGIQRSFIDHVSGDYFNMSDASLKKNISPLPPVLDKVAQLKPSSYYMKDGKEDDIQIGFIAQDIEKLFPQLVEEVSGLKGVAYSQVSVIAIKAIQELTEQNNTLQEDLQLLAKELDRLKIIVEKPIPNEATK